VLPVAHVGGHDGQSLRDLLVPHELGRRSRCVLRWREQKQSSSCDFSLRLLVAYRSSLTQIACDCRWRARTSSRTACCRRLPTSPTSADLRPVNSSWSVTVHKLCISSVACDLRVYFDSRLPAITDRRSRPDAWWLRLLRLRGRPVRTQAICCCS